MDEFIEEETLIIALLLDDGGKENKSKTISTKKLCGLMFGKKGKTEGEFTLHGFMNISVGPNTLFFLLSYVESYTIS